MINESDVQNVAKMAKLSFSEDELKKLTGELQGILKNVSIMEEIDTSNVIETAQVTGLHSVYREDIITVNGREKDLLDCSPHPKNQDSIQIAKMM